MLGLLADVCLTNSENLYGHCAKKFSQEILPVGKSALLAMSNVCEEMKICRKGKGTQLENVGVASKLLGRIRSAVEECAMCESVAGIVSSTHVKSRGLKYYYADNADDLCTTVPSDKKNMVGFFRIQRKKERKKGWNLLQNNFFLFFPGTDSVNPC